MFTEAQKNKIMKMEGYKDLVKAYKQGKKQQKGSGGDFWGDFYKVVKKTAGDANAWLKKTKAISTATGVAAKALPVVATLTGQPELVAGTPILAGISSGAKSMGYGRRTMMKSSRPRLSKKPSSLAGNSVYGAVSKSGGSKIRGMGSTQAVRQTLAYGFIENGGSRLKF